MEAKALFFPEICLTRSQRSQTGMLLYGTDVSKIFGKRETQRIYIEPSFCHSDPIPHRVKMMVFAGCPKTQTGSALVARLSLKKATDHQDQYSVHDEAGLVTTVYLPDALSQKIQCSQYPCFLCLTW